MRATVSVASTILTALALAGCGGGGTAADDDTDVDAGGDPPAEGFRIQTPPIVIEAGQEVTYCYYTTIPTTRAMGVKKWSSVMTPGSHHLILFFHSGNQADGTITRDCGITGGGLGVPFWMYSAQTPTQESPMPAGVGMTVPAGQKAFVQMHYLNTSDAPIMANVTIDAEAYPEAATYTPAAAFVTFHTGIDIPPHSTGSAEGNCGVPAGAKFFAMSTHSHHFSTRTEVKDGAAMVFESTSWDHPGAATWSAEPFYSFASGRLSYRCEYNNTSGNRVRTGDSAATDEMCMAVGYFFPANQARFCLSGF
jgi:hypothetical protein